MAASGDAEFVSNVPKSESERGNQRQNRVEEREMKLTGCFRRQILVEFWG